MSNINIDKLIGRLTLMETDYTNAVNTTHNNGNIIQSAVLGVATQLLKNIKIAIVDAIENSAVLENVTIQPGVQINDSDQPEVKTEPELPGAGE